MAIKRKVIAMITRTVLFRTTIYYLFLILSASSFISVNGLAKAMDFPIGVVISEGNVKMEVRDNVWRTVEPPFSPILKGEKIKIEKGSAILSLSNSSLIEVSQNSLLSFDHDGQLHLLQGCIHFKVPSTAQVDFKIGALSVVKPHPPKTQKGLTAALAREEETRGSLFLHPEGSLTIRCVQGSLSILDHETKVLATASSKEPITIPSNILSGKGPWRVGQLAGVQPPEMKEKFLAPTGKEGSDELEKYLIEFSTHLEGKDLPANLDAQKFFSFLETVYPHKDIIEKVKQYPVKVRNEGKSYVLTLCDKRSKWMLYKDRGETTNFVDDPYWLHGQWLPCDGALVLNQLLAIEMIPATATGVLLGLEGDNKDTLPLCP